MEQLQKTMFKGDLKAKEKAQKIVRALTAYRQNKGHNRHIHYEDCTKMGLKVEKIEADQELQDLILTVHHCYMHALMNTPSFKMIENHKGIAFVKMELQVAVQQQISQPIR